jgi:hypothetical protein
MTDEERARLEAERAALHAERLELADAVESIERQLGDARSAVYRGGDFADPHWYQSATTALVLKRKRYRHVAGRLQEADRLLGAARKEERRRHNDAFREAFVDAARRLLRPPDFHRVWKAAHAQTGHDTERDGTNDRHPHP